MCVCVSVYVPSLPAALDTFTANWIWQSVFRKVWKDCNLQICLKWSISRYTTLSQLLAYKSAILSIWLLLQLSRGAWQSRTQTPPSARERVWGHSRDFLVVRTNITSFLLLVLAIFEVGILWASTREQDFTSHKALSQKTSLFGIKQPSVRNKSHDCWVSTTKKTLQCHQTLSLAEGGVWGQD